MVFRVFLKIHTGTSLIGSLKSSPLAAGRAIQLEFPVPGLKRDMFRLLSEKTAGNWFAKNL